MKRKIIYIIIFLAVFVIALTFLISPNEKKQIKHDLLSLRKAVERKDPGAALQYFDFDYFDARHNDFESFSYSIRQLTENFDSIKILMSGIKIKIDSVSNSRTVFASCSLGLKIFARYEREKTLIFGGVVKPASVKAYLRKTQGNYRIYHAQY